MHGYGEYHNLKTNIFYIGMFEENLFSGFGILRSFTNEEIYVGYFKKNMKEGFGRTVNKDSNVLGRYMRNIVIQLLTAEENIEKFLLVHHQHLLKFFFFSLKDLNKFASLIRVHQEK